ncbi:MAG: glutamate--tRNA ligase family protein [Planctomycetota bacterium]
MSDDHDAAADAGSVSRFAPSATGRAHPGTLLAGLLCWLDARAHGARVVLRLEDLDPQRCSPALTAALRRDLDWFGLDWDLVEVQSEQAARHRAALARLERAGRLYACVCSRKTIRARAGRASDGGLVYPGTCREVATPPAGEHALRFRLPDSRIAVRDLDGSDLGATPGRDCGDPVVRRRDGAIAYHLASVVDDAAVGVDRIVRGRDLAGTTAVQVALARALTQSVPVYRHHLLLLEPHGDKLAKFHGAVACDELAQHYEPAELCGLLAHLAGLRPTAASVRPAELIADFSWQRVMLRDRALRWDGRRLTVCSP